MAITTISTLSSSDTISALKDKTNSIINKVNTVDLNNNNLILLSQSSDPADSSISAGSFVMYMDKTSGDIRIKVADDGGTVRRYTLVDYSTSSNSVTYE